MAAITNRRFIALVVCCCFLLVLPVARTQTKLALNKKLQRAIEKVRNGNTVAARIDAAEELTKLMKGINPSKVNDTTFSQLMSLLDTRDDAVRLWVALSFGQLGPRAKVAVPKLLQLLNEVDCLPGDMTSAPAIRGALERIGRISLPMPDCPPCPPSMPDCQQLKSP